MDPSERVEEFIGPAKIVSWPRTCKGNADGRKMVLELVGGDKVEVLIPQPMNCFSSLTSYWLSTYNLETNQKARIVDPKTRKRKEPRTLPGKVKARREFLRNVLYEKTAKKPREFRVWKNESGQYVLFADRPYRTPQ